MFNKDDTGLYLNGEVYDIKKGIPCKIIDEDIKSRWIECDIAMYYINNISSCFETPRVWSLVADICYAGNIEESKYIAYIFNSLWYYPYNDDVYITDEENINLFIKRILYCFPICKNYLPKYWFENF